MRARRRSSKASSQDPHGAAECIAIRLEAERDGTAFQPLLKRLGVEIARALVEQGRSHIGEPGAICGILRGTAVESEIHGKYRQRVVAHEPDFDTRGRLDPLDLAYLRIGRARRRKQGESHRNPSQKNGITARERERLQVRFSGAESCGRTRWPVTARRMSSHFFAASCTCSGVTALIFSGHSLTEAVFMPVVNAAP